MKTTLTKNGSLEFFRFVFLSVVVLWHFDNIVSIFKCGDFAVDFFFILAGGMVYRSYLIHPDQNAMDFTVRRVKRIFPEWIVTLIPIFLIHNRDSIFNGTASFEQILANILRFIHEMLFLGQNGLYEGTSNYASWFICVLIVSGGIIYSVLRFYKDKATFLFLPVFSLLALVYFYSVTPASLWSIKGFIDIPFLRGSAEIAWGACLYHYAELYQDNLQKRTLLVNLSGLFALILLIVLLFTSWRFAPYVPLFSTIVILSCYTDTSWFNTVLRNRMSFVLGGISFEMLLVHGLIKPIVSYAGIGRLPVYLSVPFYFGLVVLSAFMLKRLNERILHKVFFR